MYVTEGKRQQNLKRCCLMFTTKYSAHENTRNTSNLTEFTLGLEINNFFRLFWLHHIPTTVMQYFVMVCLSN